MPHLIVEYTDNLEDRIAIQNLLERLNETLREKDHIFPTGGIRVRAIKLENYVIADGTEEDAFVHATLKIGPGRSTEEKEEVGKALFEVLTEDFADIHSSSYLALSLNIEEFPNEGSYKQNNLHKRFK
ncbi:5-carboxymethyl-2-hydroxymuconate Delta-isomerase [Natribacillus halophilus]|uniref:5-carboxymethyl-2-hydroxymuconate delta isomerase n=1 Tax=Natribacillus halophilus TaxID=549003 RepID=A0A1G8MXC7_9BACI|nr:5-carboxymethyl-2-hydroxymuconate Delta-isomerase [Natribacillus halophilus]SDI72668.1 5-carboxymethyl-2-hydroxymuconate delta isomerase [Natribacillus halophilus]